MQPEEAGAVGVEGSGEEKFEATGSSAPFLL